MYRGFFLLSLPCLVRDPPLRPEGRVVRAPASVVGHGRCGYVQGDYSFMPANAALRCQIVVVSHSSVLIEAIRERAGARGTGAAVVELVKEAGQTRVAGQDVQDEPFWGWPTR